jgi:hypothetical protein
MEVSGKYHAPAALPRAQRPMYPFNKGLGRPQIGLNVLENKQKLLLPAGIERFIVSYNMWNSTETLLAIRKPV